MCITKSITWSSVSSCTASWGKEEAPSDVSSCDAGVIVAGTSSAATAAAPHSTCHCSFPLRFASFLPCFQIFNHSLEEEAPRSSVASVASAASASWRCIGTTAYFEPPTEFASSNSSKLRLFHPFASGLGKDRTAFTTYLLCFPSASGLPKTYLTLLAPAL